MMVALAPIQREVGIERIVVSTYQSVSGTGQKAIDELLAQSRAVLAGDAPEAKVYPHPIAFNVLPQVETFKDGDDYTTEERKVMAETLEDPRDRLRRARHLRHLRAGPGRDRPFGLGERRDQARPLAGGVPRAPGRRARLRRHRLAGEGIYPLGNRRRGNATRCSSAGSAAIPRTTRCLNIWIVGDNLRKGAATNAVQVAELLAQRDLVRVPEPARRVRVGAGPAARIAWAVEFGFAESLLILGLLLAVAAGLSGVMRGTVLSVSVLSVGLGIALALLDVVEVDADDPERSTWSSWR